MASSGGLTEEQRRRIEENKRKALAKKMSRNAPALPPVATPPKNSPANFQSTFRPAAGHVNASNQYQSPAKPPPPWKTPTATVSKPVSNSNMASNSNCEKTVCSGSVESNFGQASPSLSRTNPGLSGTDGVSQTEFRSEQAPSNAVSKPPCSSTQNNSRTSENKPPWLVNKETSHVDKSTQNNQDKPRPPWLANSTHSGKSDSEAATRNSETGTRNSSQLPPWKTANKETQSVQPGHTITRNVQSVNQPPQKATNKDISAQVHATCTSTNISSTGVTSAKVSGQCVLISRSRFQVDVGYAAVLIAIFKSMNTKHYDMQTKKWSFDLNEYTAFMQKVRPLSPDVHVAPLPWFVTSTFAAHIKGKYQDRNIPEVDLSAIDRKLVQTLLPFQREGVNFAIHRRGRLLVADDMGLGKTIQAICVACYYRHDWPLLVVVPSSVRFAWREQFLKWVPSLDAQQINVVVSGKESCTSGLVNIISYDIMVKKSEPLMAKGFNVVIMDESHSIKNIKTTRTRVALPLLKRASRVLLLSGTPALSRPNELFQQVSAVDSYVFNKFHDFGMRYCDGKKNAWGWDFAGSSNLAELQLVLEERVMIRRLKKDVLHQLPSKVREMVILDPCSIKTTSAMKTSHTMVDKLKGSDRRGALLEYFHDTCRAKATAVKEYVCELLEGDRKLLVFAHHQDMLDQIEHAVDHKGYGYIRIDGTTPAEQRNFLTTKFQQQSSVRIALLSIMAANAGLNLTAATVVVFAELFWNPGILVQAEDRAHRIGQEDCVNVHYLVAGGTADDYVWPLVQSKLDVLSRAGLTGDDFSEADTKRHVDPRQRQMMDYFEQSFIEDRWEGEEKGETEAGETEKGEMEESQKRETAAVVGAQGSQSSTRKVIAASRSPRTSRRRGKSSQSPGKSAALPRSPVKQSSLFQYFQPSPKKQRTSEGPSDSAAWCDDATNDDDLLLVEEEYPDTPWPPPQRK